MPDLLEQIATLVRSGRYRLRLHAIRHMIEEGFDEGSDPEVLDIVTAYIPQQPWWVTPYRRGEVR